MAKIISEELYEELAELAEDFGCSANPEYSGRSMYGRECFAVSGDSHDLHRFLLAVARERGELGGLLDDAPSQDALGLRSVWYWPGLQVEDR